MSEHFIRGMTAPDLMCVCIDERGAAGSSGRLYHRYGKEPGLFQNEYQLLTLMEELMDRIGYPQASVEMRSYGKKNPETGRGGENPRSIGRGGGRAAGKMRHLSGARAVPAERHLAGRDLLGGAAAAPDLPKRPGVVKII